MACLVVESFVQHYWKLASCSSVGWTLFLMVRRQSIFRSNHGQSINKFPWLVTITLVITNAETTPPSPCVCEELDDAYLHNLAWNPRNTSNNWLSSSKQLALRTRCVYIAWLIWHVHLKSSLHAKNDQIRTRRYYNITVLISRLRTHVESKFLNLIIFFHLPLE